MKNHLLILLLFVCAALASTNRLVTVSWPAIPNEPGTTGPIAYRLLHKQDAAQPWTQIVETVETNVTMSVIEGVNFFTVTSSNFWGVSPPGVIVVTPPVATPPAISIHLTP